MFFQCAHPLVQPLRKGGQCFGRPEMARALFCHGRLGTQGVVNEVHDINRAVTLRDLQSHGLSPG